ncbi:MAG TPA: hypothetical protein PKL31_08665 [Fulvivirga sp.]|nr:hypothetical protein [Fulvivirga sp.]
MNYRRLGHLSFVILLFVGLSSCESNKKDEQEKNAEEFDQAGAELKDQIQEVVYEIPSPSEIPFLLEATGAEYNSSLIHDINQANKYTSINDKSALNLGIYATDIGYLVSYDKVQESLTYMGTAKKLADNLGITGSFDVSLVKRFEENLSRKDSLSYLLNETIQNTENYLRDDNRNKLAALIVSGSFIEGLYISTQLIASYPKDILPEDSRNLVLTPLIRVVLEQQKACLDLTKMLENVESSNPIDELLANMNLLNKSYAALNIEEQIKNNRADLVLTDKTLTDITTRVADMRASIIK